ncbi:hypothetical protein BREVNS_1161 [Brevinematales bacterium NS]|nr:hypothetical protein BREVNS_1161 [Brevinematales bacterium NS]
MHGCFLPLFRSGATPLFPAFSVYKGLFVVFIQKIGLLITAINIFILLFVFLLLF